MCVHPFHPTVYNKKDKKRGGNIILTVSVLSIICLFSIMMLLIQTVRGLEKIPIITRKAAGIKQGPLVSVIIAAKEEEKHIEKTIKSLFNQIYSNMEVIVVNDRSEDNTGKIVDKLANKKEEHKDIRYDPIHIRCLPDGWLGKNHALHQGYLQSKGDYLLFTDADITFHSKSLSNVMEYVTANHAEHLSMSPHFRCSSFPLKAFIHLFLGIFCFIVQPWKVFEQGDKQQGMGVGAFNLIKRSTYQDLGTHQAFPLEPLDDVELGRKASALNCNQHFVIGKELIEVEWYPTLKEAINGFKKNLFGATGYKLSNAIIFTLVLILLGIYPFIGVFLFEGWNFFICLLSLLFLFTLYTIGIQKVSFPSWSFIAELVIFPLTTICYIYTLHLSAYAAIKKGGIYWRGTFYSLQELKKAKQGERAAK
ncbi:glycosyltransferase [Domibacillus sp. 8LH]|uniref:glycosyltransferase n=1 Tax=Domibacillus sp. 8LH TaxID=3073900 RepID=UPI00316D3500